MLRTLAVLALFLPTLALAALPLGPGNPPPGVTSEAWGKMHGRADWVARSVAALARKVNRECVYAVALELLGETERAWSEDVSGRDGASRSVQAGKEKDFTRALKANSEDQCGGPGGMAGTARGLLRFASEQSEWESANYEQLKAHTAAAATALLSAMGLATMARGTAAVPTSVALPILDPRLFMPAREPDGA